MLEVVAVQYFVVVKSDQFEVVVAVVEYAQPAAVDFEYDAGLSFQVELQLLWALLEHYSLLKLVVVVQHLRLNFSQLQQQNTLGVYLVVLLPK